MRTGCLFLLLYLGTSCLRTGCAALPNGTCAASGLTQQNCSATLNATADFLVCVGVPSGPGAEQLNLLHLQGLVKAMLDVYSLLNSSVVPLLDLSAAVSVNPGALLQDEDFIRLWVEIKLTPLLSSISQYFLTCLSNSNFSCKAYQTVVEKLSQHFSGLDPVQQKWIYSFFMYPFLSRNTSAGCVLPGDSSEDWLMKNFGLFSVLARFRDFTSMNMLFSGLEVLHLLSPEQKAELLLYPEVASLDNTSLSLVFNSLMDSVGGVGHPVTAAPNGSLWGAAMPSMFIDSQQDPFIQAVNGFMTVFKPAGSFAREFVSFMHQPNLTSMSSGILVQAMLNWTLAELAAPYKESAMNQPQPNQQLFDPKDVNSWFTYMVVPILNRFLPSDIPGNLTAVFHNVFYIENGMNKENETLDICSVTLDETCPMTDMLEYVGKVLQCAASVNLTLNEETITGLTVHLSDSLLALMNQLAMTNYSSLDSPFSHILDNIHKPSPGNLQDEVFVSTWFQIRLKPLLSTLTPEYLVCLSAKPFSCQTYQILVRQMSNNMFLITKEAAHTVYMDFFSPYLSRQNSTGACMTNSSSDWIILNLGGFSQFATVQEMYLLNSQFNALQALDVLTPMQTAEIIVKDLPALPNKIQVIDTVFNHTLMSPAERRLPEVLRDIIFLASQEGMQCSSYQEIMKQLYMSSVPQEMQWIVQNTFNNFSVMAPLDCRLPSPMNCFSINVNKTIICAGINSTGPMNVSCNTGLEQIACSQPGVFPVSWLASFLQCKLESSIIYSRETWVLFLNEVSKELDKALSLLSGKLTGTKSLQASNLLDAIGEVRLDKFSPEDLADNSFITQWFDGRLKYLLPSASQTFLSCLGSRNFSCQTFQTMVLAFSGPFAVMDQFQKEAVVNNVILQFLKRNKIGCRMPDSVQWLLTNFEQFSPLVSLPVLMNLNPLFNPLTALPYLSPRQLADIMVMDLPGLPPKDEAIRTVLGFLTDPTWQDRLPAVLQHLADATNISCSSYRIILEWVDHLFPNVPTDVQVVIVNSKSSMLHNIPPGCVLYSGQCNTTSINETVCMDVNSSALMMYLSRPQNSSQQLCNFSITQYACAELTGLSPDQLATVLACYLSSNNTVSDETWKLFITNVNAVLGPALDTFTNRTLPWSQSLVRMLDMIGEVTLSKISSSSYRNTSFIYQWFQNRLRPFLPYASPHFLSCLASKNFSCNTYQIMVKSFSQLYSVMPRDTQISIYVDFIQRFLSLEQNAGCTGEQSSDWLVANVGPFSIFASITDLQRFNPNFSPLDSVGTLTLQQVVEVASSPGLLSSSSQVDLLLQNVPDSHLSEFFFALSLALTTQDVRLPAVVRTTLLQQVFDRANLSSPSVTDEQVQEWLRRALPPLIPDLPATLVPQYFSIVVNRPCPVLQQAVGLLNSNISTFNADTQQVIYNQIINSLIEPRPLRCYGNQSYYSFLTSSFMNFQFPDLPTFLSLLPPGQEQQLLNSTSPTQLSSYLNNLTISDPTQLCQLFDIYPRTTEYLQSQPVQSPDLARQTLECVWPLALSVSSQVDVNQWFNVYLAHYLPYLSYQLISPAQLNDSSCLAFRKFVSLMGTYNFSRVNFSAQDIYHTIQVYFTTDSSPRCYVPSDPVLNSTAWFVNYIGVFITFLTQDDLIRFGNTQLSPFMQDPVNLQLFNSSTMSSSFISYYTEVLYGANPSFSATLLPPAFRCLAPASAFTALSSQDATAIIQSLHQFCTNIEPDVTAALAMVLSSDSSTSISALGNYSTGLSTGQLSTAPPAVLVSSLSVLSTVVGWSQGQTLVIIQSMLSAGVIKINSADSLLQLGTLVTGVPSSVINQIPPSQLLTALQSPVFMSNIIRTPIAVQESIVNQLILLNASSDGIVTNVPDSMATLIPRVYLVNLTQSSVAVLNRKSWKHEQAFLLFDLAANGIPNPDNISFSMLQGFTCTVVQNYEAVKVHGLIKSCRHRGNTRVALQESQLTCMYNYIKNYNPSVFTEYPSEMLLYYDYSLIGQSRCQSYISALGSADFSVISSTLASRKQLLWANARQCLGISGLNINQMQLDILGNMVCVVNGSYIQNSDPYVLEILKRCPGLSADQISAVENILLTRNTIYGVPTSWNVTTLTNLGSLPLYLSSAVWSQITKNDKLQFFRTFVPQQKKSGVSPSLISNMMTAALLSRTPTKSTQRAKRDTACTVGQITQVQVSDGSFPFSYDVMQFDACLSVQVLKDNLADIAQKAFGSSYQRVILDKLNQGGCARAVRGGSRRRG
ncbi:uncharacterized protein LOC143484076 isoform X2 [Brachyhypopomus gauderio]|uniref:uncharacterized protein LOC143484076 isoform X2 n=1 Tax=Brachyhypopomus gauderio TaxID=698409 RepID=UPI004043282E